MLNTNVNIDFNSSAVTRKVNRATKKAQYVFDDQVLKDSNFFIPADQWILRDSSLRASDIGGGQLTWDTPYARRLYYNPQFNFDKDKNPSAGGLWFEFAKSIYYDDWVRLANDEVNKNL
ncbi:minor capsid protein [Halobacillus sp. Cin3]|uniref:minor capsid protein n=1 Tax=Halobacillus sp. Cin3 TaxID=2928441 RepID=UPI00248F09FA|nr:minor capsid protein [Halobacillus sp. Cin3]